MSVAWAGLHWGLSMASLGLLISRSLYLSQSLITLVVWFGVGAPMLLAVNKIVGVLIFPALSIEDEIYTAVRQRDPTVLPRQRCAALRKRSRCGFASFANPILGSADGTGGKASQPRAQWPTARKQPLTPRRRSAAYGLEPAGGGRGRRSLWLYARRHAGRRRRRGLCEVRTRTI